MYTPSVFLFYVSGMTVGAKVLKRCFDDNALIQIGLLSVFISTIIPVFARTDAGLFLGKQWLNTMGKQPKTGNVSHH